MSRQRQQQRRSQQCSEIVRLRLKKIVIFFFQISSRGQLVGRFSPQFVVIFSFDWFNEQRVRKKTCQVNFSGAKIEHRAAVEPATMCARHANCYAYWFYVSVCSAHTVSKCCVIWSARTKIQTEWNTLSHIAKQLSLWFIHVEKTANRAQHWRDYEAAAVAVAAAAIAVTMKIYQKRSTN